MLFALTLADLADKSGVASSSPGATEVSSSGNGNLPGVGAAASGSRHLLFAWNTHESCRCDRVV